MSFFKDFLVLKDLIRYSDIENNDSEPYNINNPQNGKLEKSFGYYYNGYSGDISFLPNTRISGIFLSYPKFGHMDAILKPNETLQLENVKFIGFDGKIDLKNFPNNKKFSVENVALISCDPNLENIFLKHSDHKGNIKRFEYLSCFNCSEEFMRQFKNLTSNQGKFKSIQEQNQSNKIDNNKDSFFQKYLFLKSLANGARGRF